MEVLNDFDTSVSKALGEIYPKWRNLPGLIVCGTHAPHDVNYMLDRIAECREDGTPYLGICFGHQLAAIQYARDVLGIEDATSEEFGEGTFVVKKRPEKKVGLFDGESWWSFFEVVIDWSKPKNFFTSPYHPEYQSTFKKPHPDLKAFIKYAKKHGKNLQNAGGSVQDSRSVLGKGREERIEQAMVGDTFDDHNGEYQYPERLQAVGNNDDAR